MAAPLLAESAAPVQTIKSVLQYCIDTQWVEATVNPSLWEIMCCVDGARKKRQRASKRLSGGVHPQVQWLPRGCTGPRSPQTREVEVPVSHSSFARLVPTSLYGGCVIPTAIKLLAALTVASTIAAVSSGVDIQCSTEINDYGLSSDLAKSCKTATGFYFSNNPPDAAMVLAFCKNDDCLRFLKNLRDMVQAGMDARECLIDEIKVNKSIVAEWTTCPTTTPAPLPAPTTIAPAPTTPAPTSTAANVTPAPAPALTPAPTPSSSNSGTTIGVAAAAAVVVVAIVAFICFRCGKKRAAAKAQAHRTEVNEAAVPIETPPAYAVGAPFREVATPAPRVPLSKGPPTPSAHHSTGSSVAATTNSSSYDPKGTSQAQKPMWEDEALLAARVPYDSVFLGPLLSRGGFGEVYKGTYRGETVAIKQLLPERRKDMKQIDGFLTEAKLMSTLEHERIIKFIGVAWNALTDACVIVEYMENGDLRSVITRWEDEGRPQGFHADEVKIALHIAHALTYLHSLQPVVVHRDLKSKNILLDGNFDAKLTAFGVSRERADSTMTGGVGSSLWMAPEVMMGERYDEKADVFSFGIVLSELDTHQLPYAHAKNVDSSYRTPDSAILQMVSLGRLQVEFSDNAHPEMVRLARECLQLDAKKRPTTAAVLHRVHQVQRSYSGLI